MKRSYVELTSHFASLFSSHSFFSWVFGIPRAVDRWFDVRMDSLLGLIALRRARTSVNASGLSADELKHKIG